jgi:hypothetical protein
MHRRVPSSWSSFFLKKKDARSIGLKSNIQLRSAWLEMPYDQATRRCGAYAVRCGGVATPALGIETERESAANGAKISAEQVLER